MFRWRWLILRRYYYVILIVLEWRCRQKYQTVTPISKYARQMPRQIWHYWEVISIGYLRDILIGLISSPRAYSTFLASIFTFQFSIEIILILIYALLMTCWIAYSRADWWAHFDGHFGELGHTLLAPILPLLARYAGRYLPPVALRQIISLSQYYQPREQYVSRIHTISAAKSTRDIAIHFITHYIFIDRFFSASR